MNATREQDDVTAAEYVLGTLRGAAREAFSQRLAAEPALRSQVHAWERRLAGLNTGFDPVTPREIVWSAIDRQINAQRDSMAPGRVRFLQAWASLATAASVVLAVALVWQLRQGAPPPQVIREVVRVEVPVEVKVPMPYVAVLKPDGSQAQWLVSLSPERGMIRVTGRGDYPIDPSKQALELWIIDDAGTPHSLGLIPVNAAGEMPMPKDMPMPAKPTLAVSMEPSGGSPTGQPTGPVIVATPAERAS